MDSTDLWEDDVNTQTICEHYGYQDVAAVLRVLHGFWPKGAVLENIAKIPELLRMEAAEEKKFRIILDYDPEFPRAMIQILMDRDSAQPS